MKHNWLISILLPASCGGSAHHAEKNMAAPQQPQQEAVEYTPVLSHFHKYLQGLIHADNISEDTTWLAAIPLQERERSVMTLDLYADSGTDTTVSRFPFTDVDMSYRTIGSRSQFTINGYKLPFDKDDQRIYPSVIISNIHKLRYRGLQFIYMRGGLAQYNGYGDRIQFNYFFHINAMPPVQDIYTNNDGTIYQPILYGDINNDTLLDRIVYNGILYPYCADTCALSITAQTYKQRHWQPLMAPNGKPMEIIVNVDGDMDSVRKVIYSNWAGK